MVTRAGPNAIFQASNTRQFFRASIRILVPEKHTIKSINNTYILPGTDFDSICIFCWRFNSVWTLIRRPWSSLLFPRGSEQLFKSAVLSAISALTGAFQFILERASFRGICTINPQQIPNCDWLMCPYYIHYIDRVLKPKLSNMY